MLCVFRLVFLASVVQVCAFSFDDSSSDSSSDSSETGGMWGSNVATTKRTTTPSEAGGFFGSKNNFGFTATKPISSNNAWNFQPKAQTTVSTSKNTFNFGSNFGQTTTKSPFVTTSKNSWNFGSNFGKTTTKSPSGFQNLGFGSNFGKATTKKSVSLDEYDFHTTKSSFNFGIGPKAQTTKLSNTFGLGFNTPKPATSWGGGATTKKSWGASPKPTTSWGGGRFGGTTKKSWGATPKPTMSWGGGATTKKSWGATPKPTVASWGDFGATTRSSWGTQPTNPSKNVKNPKPRSTYGQDNSSSKEDDPASIALRIATSNTDDKDKYDEKTLEDAISINKESIKGKMKEFKEDISEDIFFRFLAKLSIENYEDDFDFYYREVDAMDCEDLGIYDIVVAYVADDTKMQDKIKACSGGHEVK